MSQDSQDNLPDLPIEHWPVVVVGAGPAGLLAAIRAAERGRRVLLLEKGRKPGAKILMSGGNRCNLTHATDARGIVEAFGPAGRFLYSALAALGPPELVALVEAEGVPTKVEAGGKVFPASDRALDVQAALLRRLARVGCTVALGEPAQAVRRGPAGLQVVTPRRTLQAGQLVLATGGKSYPGCGTTGDGYQFAAELGHAVVRPRPALVPVRTAAAWIPPLAGVTLADVLLRVEQPGPGAPPSELARCRGALLFAHFGLTGPAVLNVSRAIAGHPKPSALVLDCDLAPAMVEAELSAHLEQRRWATGKRQTVGILDQFLPRRLISSLLQQIGIPPDQRMAELSRRGRGLLVGAIKHLRIPVAGTLGFEKAEVTAGGIDLAEIDSRSMRSKRVPGLLAAGELLDLDGPIGGYNFQAAFSTGWLAGENV
jgi:hypothetical protein